MKTEKCTHLLELQRNNLNRELGLQDFNREVLEDIINLLAQFLCLHLTKFEICVLKIPNDARFFFFDERALGLVLVCHHEEADLVDPAAVRKKEKGLENMENSS